MDQQQQTHRRKITLSKGKQEKMKQTLKIKQPTPTLTLTKQPEKKTEEEIIADKYNMMQLSFTICVYAPIPKDATDIYYKYGQLYFTHNNEKKKIDVSGQFESASDYKYADSEKILEDSPVDYGYDTVNYIENTIIEPLGVFD